MQRLLAALGLTSVRTLLVGWGVSALVLLAGLVLVLTGVRTVGIVVFLLGAVMSFVVTIGMLRLRASIPREQPRAE